MQIQDIKNDFQQRIYSARSDKSLKGKARRQKVRELRNERDHEINQARIDYYKTPRNYNYRNNNNGNNNNGSNKNNNSND
jgi:hypothetical protein